LGRIGRRGAERPATGCRAGLQGIAERGKGARGAGNAGGGDCKGLQRGTARNCRGAARGGAAACKWAERLERAGGRRGDEARHGP
jgi:hypothetical protein